jgi:hypothetical protein
MAERRHIAERRLELGRTKTATARAPLIGVVGAVGLAVLILVISQESRRHALPHPLVAAARVVNAGPADANVELVSMDTVFDAMRHARTITLAAFSLRRESMVVRTLESASARRARVSVVLARGFGIYARQNSETARELAAHGVRVRILPLSRRPTHIKAAILDGQVYLSDRNWTSRSSEELVIHDSVPGDRVLVERSLLGQSGANGHLWTRKADALLAEAGMLASAHSHRIRVSSESFGLGTPVYRQLVQRKKVGDEVLLLIARSEYARSRVEREAVSRLLVAGVKIRLSSSNEKMAVDGDTVWMGSANATAGVPDQLDFGMVVTSGMIAARLQKQFDEEWERGGAI